MKLPRGWTKNTRHMRKEMANTELCYTKSSIPFIGETTARLWFVRGGTTLEFIDL